MNTKGTPLKELLKEKIAMPCAGQGRCGKCRVKIYGNVNEPDEVEKKFLTQQELERGIRLACRTIVQGEFSVSLLETGKSDILLLENKEVQKGKPLYEHLGVAVDIGTTTVALCLYDENGLVAQDGIINPQVSYGADVISRIECSLKGEAKQLAKVIRTGIADLLKKVTSEHSYKVEEIDTLVITGNTAMLYLLTERNPKTLSCAPFEADWLAGEWFSANELDLGCPNANVYLPHCISAFVGADITTALLATKIDKTNEKRLLVDIGTNGEVVLWNGESFLCCSTAAGPAFEGAGLSMGMDAKEGAIYQVSLKYNTLEAKVIGEKEPIGICGSGVIDAIYCLLANETLDETGYLEEDAYISGNVKLTQEDIRKIQLAKSAICAGIMALLNHEKMTTKELDALIVAGGFGSKINILNAMYIGLLPWIEQEKVVIAGNAALEGARMILCQSELVQKEAEIAKKAKSMNLATDAYFQECYIEGMFFGGE